MELVVTTNLIDGKTATFATPDSSLPTRLPEASDGPNGQEDTQSKKGATLDDESSSEEARVLEGPAAADSDYSTASEGAVLETPSDSD